jgi:hypothetical protein
LTGLAAWRSSPEELRPGVDRVDRFEDFLSARRQLLATAMNEVLAL